MLAQVKEVDLQGCKHYRIIPSVFPPINFFEDLVDPDEMEMLWEIEALTDERLRQEAGDIFLVPREDRVSGPGASVVMAAFTHIGRATRFSNGSYGVYYAGLTKETSIRETVYHREVFMRATKESPCEITMRLYEGHLLKPVHDLRGDKFKKFHNKNDYTYSQAFGSELRGIKSWGLIYNSVRHEGGQCLAIFRPPAISKPVQASHLRYVWDGQRITDVFDASLVMGLTA